MFRKMTNNLKKGLVAFVLLGSMAFMGGCTVSVDGLGDLGDWIVDVLDSYYGCPYCNDIIIEYDD
jgi:hypothetical protein